MPIRKPRLITFRARGVSDTPDSTDVPAGAMASLSNLIPAPQMAEGWVPRPASTLFSAVPVPGGGTAGQVEALFVSGARIYGLVQVVGGSFAGLSVPFIFDTGSSSFITISGLLTNNCPTSTANSGDWTPPSIDQVGAYIVFTHPGFPSQPRGFGILDMTGVASTTITGNTHSNTVVDNLSTNVLLAGWRPGKLISDTAGDIPANTRIQFITAGGLSLTLDTAATGTNATTFNVQGGTFAAPLWSAANMNINPTIAIPQWVAQYAGCACFAVNTSSPPSAAVQFSDVGDPMACTNASQVITLRNSQAVTCLKGLPLNNAVSGGILQSLVVFQSVAAIFQITGSPAAANVSVNSLNDSTGTLAPNSVQSTPRGMLFAAPDGIRRINDFAVISETIGRRGDGVTTPFLFAKNPSRMCAAYNEGVYRISVQNGAAIGTPTQEYWFHEDDKFWTGPHTFPATVIAATQSPHGFVLAASGINGKLWNSSAYASSAALYTENGVQMTFAWQTSLLPDDAQMQMNALIDSDLALAVPAQQAIQATSQDETGFVMGATQVFGTSSAPAIWGTAAWGTAMWGAGISYFRQRNMLWPAPIVFKQMTILLTGNCVGGLIIGNLYMRYSQLGYALLIPTTPAA